MIMTAEFSAGWRNLDTIDESIAIVESTLAGLENTDPCLARMVHAPYLVADIVNHVCEQTMPEKERLTDG